MIKATGKGGITATVVAHSSYKDGPTIITFELEYPRFIHGEFMTHRQFSRNAASSRAIPISTMIQSVLDTPASPIHWGENQSGMQAAKEVGDIERATYEWKHASIAAAVQANRLKEAGLHKQIANRVLETFQMMKVVVTATEYENFFYLRDHADAQPEIAELARVMRKALAMSEPNELRVGEWHLPYVDFYRCPEYGNVFYSVGGEDLYHEEAIKVSASMCAQVSYRKSDDSVEKALRIYDMLVNNKPVHASPFEHQASPMAKDASYPWDLGVTHIDHKGQRWSGNFKGWAQYRQLISGNAVYG